MSWEKDKVREVIDDWQASSDALAFAVKRAIRETIEECARRAEATPVRICNYRPDCRCQDILAMLSDE